jgi:predicted Zn-dependent protease
MKRILLEVVLLLGGGVLFWIIVAYFINLPEKPVLLSIENEQIIGEKYKNIIISLPEFSKVENSYVETLFSKIAQQLEDVYEESKYTYNITLTKNTMANAFALPGGQIIVTTGLVEFCDNSGELIAVICHEIGHIEKRHVISRLLKEMGLGLIFSSDPIVGGEIARMIISSTYSRKQEEEADRFACDLMVKCGFEPKLLAQLFRKLKDESDMYETFEIISSHPNMNSRIKAILSYKMPEHFQPKTEWFDIAELKAEIQ